MSKLDEAIAFAATAHAGQTRKYSTLPYIIHPIEVMTIAATEGGLADDEVALIAAVLHDVVEDTPVTYNEISRRFGHEVVALVADLTDADLSQGNRATRKALDRERLSKADARAQTIKLADLISNTTSIVEHDPGFARKYLQEKEAVLEVLTRGSPALRRRAQESLRYGQEELMMHHMSQKQPPMEALA